MREQLLHAAQVLVQDRGLDAVSFQDLADAVGLKKPSVFHHFRNKDELAQALMTHCHTAYGARYGEVLQREDLNEPEKLRAIARIFDEGLRTDHLCLLSSLSQNCNRYSDNLKQEIHETVSVIVARYAPVFEAGRRNGTLDFKGTAEQAGAAFLAMLQGLQVLTRANGDVESFLPTASSYIDSISMKPKAEGWDKT